MQGSEGHLLNAVCLLLKNCTCKAHFKIKTNETSKGAQNWEEALSSSRNFTNRESIPSLQLASPLDPKKHVFSLPSPSRACETNINFPAGHDDCFASPARAGPKWLI